MEKYRYWSLLRRAYQDFHKAQEATKIRLPIQHDFVSWMAEHWGIRVHLNPMGYTEYFDIADEHKYLLFELKYAGHTDT